MKIRYPIIEIIVILILFAIIEPLSYTSYYTLHGVLANILIILFLTCIGLSISLIIRNIFRAIKSIITKGSTKKQSSWKLQNIDRTLDKIKSTLDAMTEVGQEDDKITPIWGTGTKKDR